jgi:hypothetical protein
MVLSEAELREMVEWADREILALNGDDPRRILPRLIQQKERCLDLLRELRRRRGDNRPSLL